MNGDLALEVQQAIFRSLTNDPVLAGLLGKNASGQVRVFDSVPDGEAMEFIHVGDVIWNDWGDKTDPGQDGVFTLHVWTRQKANLPLYKIGREITRIFHQQRLVLSVGEVTLLRQTFSQVLVDANGRDRQLVKNYRITTSDPQGTP